MFDVALSSAGASIALATSFDENYPPENIIDGWVICGATHMSMRHRATQAYSIAIRIIYTTGLSQYFVLHICRLGYIGISNSGMYMYGFNNILYCRHGNHDYFYCYSRQAQ